LRPPALDARVRKLASAAGFSILGHRALRGDVGARRYTRLLLKGGGTVLAVVYPEAEMEARTRWIRVRDALALRVRVPELLADDGRAVELLEDFGDVSFARLWRAAGPAGRRRLARQAARVAATIAGTRDPGANPPFSAEFFQAELQKSVEAFFGAFARSPLSGGEEDAHAAFAKALCREIAAHPRAFLHRDFHADNLFAVGDELGVIDFQDARRGPDSYDLASLTRERATLLDFDPAAEAAALRALRTTRPPAAGFRRRMLRVRLQRAWKAAGTFAGVCARGDGSRLARRYLAGEVGLVLALLGTAGAEGEFRKILSRRSGKLLPSVNEEAKC
jgi:aminoglycoside/choline kinase family phosphotransferase